MNNDMMRRRTNYVPPRTTLYYTPPCTEQEQTHTHTHTEVAVIYWNRKRKAPAPFGDIFTQIGSAVM
ncbi:unnamed protein product [Amoebophrya sp. A25]|nr:unnamed protein product [Amoebophrya sp. A25]|eukprot:GSA25T00021821001.1